MNNLTIYHIALVTHITGLTMMAGATLAHYITFKQFWKQVRNDKPKGLAIREAMSKLPLLVGIGFILLIISGVGMMAITRGAFGEQIWFRIKFGLIILIILNGLAIGRKQDLKLTKILSEGTSGKDVVAKLLRVKNNLNQYHIAQLAFFLIIFILSVFKFN